MMSFFAAALPLSLQEKLYFAQEAIEVSETRLAQLQASGLQLPDSFNRAVLKRRVEFLQGRSCIRHALNQASIPCHGALPISAQRYPLWPHGVVGSVSHSSRKAVAVIAKKQHIRAVGIDIESIISHPVLENIHASIARDEEIQHTRDAGLDWQTGCSLIFSAKESLFKALYPHVGRYFDFPAARLCSLDSRSHSIRFTLTETLSAAYDEGTILTCYYSVLADEVLTLYVEPEPDPAAS